MKTEKIKKDYLSGMTYKDIFKKYNITLSDLKKIINKYKLTRDKKELLRGNQNAKKNKGGHAPEGNKNAVKTGEYEKIYADVLTDEEKKLFKSYKIGNVDNLLMTEYLSEYKLLTIRELRMMKRIHDLEEKIKNIETENVNKRHNEDDSEKENDMASTLNMIQRIEDGLTRIVEAKRKSRENMIKLGFSKRELELKEKQAEEELW